MEKKDQAASVSQDALEKALSQLNDLAKSEKDEKQDLLSKALNGDISPEDNARLLTLMQGKTAEGTTLAKSATASLQPANAPAVQQAVDVSEYLNAFHTGALTSLEAICDTIEKSSTQQHEFNLTLAKAVVQLGNLVKSLDSRIEQWGEGTSEAPKAARGQAQAQAQTQAAPLAKSFGGAAPEGEQIQKGEVLSLLEAMHVDAIQKGRNGQALCGEDLNKSIAKYEQTGRMTRPLVEEMKTFRAKRGAS